MAGEAVVELWAQGGPLAPFFEAAYAPVRAIHITGGVVALLAGASALLFRKGERAHRTAGLVFLISMLVVGASGPLISESRVGFLTPILAAYFVATAWRSAKREERSASGLEAVALALAASLAVAYVVFGLQAAARPDGLLDGYPASFHYVFAGVAGFASALDLNVVLRSTIAWAPRIARHLWRMCFALVFAGASFFIGQADRHPDFMRESGVLAPIALAPLAFMLFWLIRVRFLKGTTLPGFLALPGRVIGLVYLIVIAAGLLALFRPRGL